MNKTETNEILRLRKELIHQRNVAADLQEELEEKTNLYIKAIADRDQYREKLNNAKESVSRVEQIVQSKLNLLMEKERKELDKLRSENQMLIARIEIFDQEKLANQQREKTQQDKIMALTQDLQFYARNVDMRDFMAKIDIIRSEKNEKEKKITELLQDLNKKSNELENALAENRELRKMANVPENFGINVEQIKFFDREKIDDYKKLIRVLQEDNYRLEEERAKLKHMLKQQSILYKTDQPNLRYKNLTPDQLSKVDMYVLKLLSGDTEEPADFYKLKKENQILKAQLDVLNTKGFDFAKGQIETFLKELGLSDSSKFLEKLMSGNEELKKMLRELLTKGFTMSGSIPQIIQGSGQNNTQPINHFGDLGKFRPPLPNVGVDGDIQSGYSYKFQTHLDVKDKDGRIGLADQTKYDVAFLQLQLIEFIEIIKRKDDELSNKNNEIEHLYKKVRDYLLVQDQLYKDFVKQEKDYNNKKNELDTTLKNTRDNLYQEQLKVKKLESLIDTLTKGDRQSIENRIIELTKQNSILDVNLLKLTRKYQILEEQEQILRREYHNKEADLAEKDRYIQLRINMLKDWKARAIQQLKFLFNKLRLAVPLTEYQSIQSENEILKQKNADYIDRNTKLELKAAKLQTKVRDNMEAEERLKTLQEIKEDVENEYEVIRKRLEQVDQAFKWENAVFNKIVATLKRYKVSPQQAFEEFDVNRDGKLTKDEFIRGLNMLKVQDLTNEEIDVLIGSVDIDSDGAIRYKEFVRKLSRHGVRSRTSEEQIIYLLVESLRRTGIRSLSKAFELFDKERRGSLSREDFKDVFKNMKLRIEENDIDKFIDHFWKDKKAGIDYHEFLRIFSRYQVKLDEDENNRKTGYDRIPDDVLRLKKKIYQEMETAFKRSGKSLKNLFDRIDIDNSNQIDFNEFKSMFQKMNVQINDKEVRDIFNSIDFDWSGHITYPEFVADFEKTLRTDILTLIQEEKERVEAEKQGLSQSAFQANQISGGRNQQPYSNQVIAGGIGRQSQELQLQTRIAILEAREKQLGRKLETSLKVLNHAQQSQLESQQQYDQLEKKWNHLTEQFHFDKQRLRELEEELKLSIRKDEAIKLKQMTEQLQTECVETKAAMLTYKNMTEVISDQVRGLKLAMERRKDENENLVNAVREISAQSEDQKRLGKMYYLIMLSRWQEAAVNKKYDMVLTENRELRKELMNTEQLYQNKEYEHHEAENIIQERQLQVEKFKKQIADSQNIFLTLEKEEELNNIIKEIADEKSDLEENYFEIRTKYRSTQLLMDEAIVKADHANELLEFLQKSKQSEMSDRMIELSNMLQSIRLNEMRANRESSEQKEKNNYLSRLLRQQNDQVRKLEERAAEFESRLHRREEEFRKIDNDRMRRFFNARFDDLNHAFINGNGGFGENNNNFFSNARSSGVGARGNDDLNGSGGSRLNRNISNNSPGEFHYRLQNNFARESNDNFIRGQNQQDSKFLEGKIKRLEIELQNAVEQIKQKDIVINRFKDWQLNDKYLSEDMVLKELVDRHKSNVSQVHDQESKEMADAAAQMVKTMQEMLDQKNEQLKSKEAMIERIRQQMATQREQDGMEIARLQNQMSLAAGTTLSNLQKIVLQNEASGGNNAGGMRLGGRYDQLTREELSQALDEKDRVIKNLQANVEGADKSVAYLKEQNQNLRDQIDDLKHELNLEREQVELKAKVKELERIKKELKEKDKLNTNLRQAIDALNERMQKYEIQNSNVSEDQKIQKIQDDMKKKEHLGEVKKLKDKLALVESSRNQKAEELKQAKAQEMELKQAQQKLIVEKEELTRSLRQTRDRLDQEIRQREKLQIEVNNIKGRTQIGSGFGPSNGLSYEQLQGRIKELENDIIILQCQQKTVVVYNKESGTFEYIGEPIYLNHDRELGDIDEFLASMKAWLSRNDRLTLKSIFESMDRENFGELSEAKFEMALLKIGVKLRQNEKRIIKEALDPRGIGFLRYRPLVKELQGIPQLDFIVREVIKLAKLVESRDLMERGFKLLVDPRQEESMNLTQLQESFAQVNCDTFNITQEEVEYLFKHVTKSVRTIGVVLSVDRLTEKVFTAFNAILIEKTKDAISKSPRTFQESFARHDSNKDNFLEYVELENLLLECQIAFKPSAFERLLSILDPGKKISKISYNTLRFFISGETSSHENHIPSVQRSYDYEPSLDKANLSEETSIEEINICRSGARKILSFFQSGSNQKSLIELFSQRDKHNEGIISREETFAIIQEAKVSELTAGELNMLMKYVDKGNKGYISINNFMEKLYELATESKQEIQLRTFAMNVKRQGINLKQEMFKYDTARNGRLDKKTFIKAMNQLPVSLTDEGIDLLFQCAEHMEYRGTLDIKMFLDKVLIALKQKPLPNFQPQPKAAVQSKVASLNKSKTGDANNGGAFENWELEKKYKTKLTALQQQIEESKKETQAVEKQAKHWQEMANRLEKEKNGLQARLVDVNAKPPKAAREESQGLAQLETMQQLKDQVYYLQEENTKLEKNIQVELKAEIGRLSRENEKLTERLKHFQDEARKNENTIQRIIGRPMDNLEKREEGELWREQRIKDLEKELEQCMNREQELHEQLFKSDEKLLDLKFMKETFDLQYARLQKRITDLEQYKLESSKYSAVLKRQENEEVKNIEENSNALSNLTGAQPNQSKKQQDTVKLRSKSSKTVGELEMLIESLKRVIEKQKVENESLKKQIETAERNQEKLKSEKQLRQKIESLSQEVHAYEMKDINMDEKEKTVKKLIEANRLLRQDLEKEAERYKLLENKYKEILVKYNILAKENAKNAEMLFSMNTGGNIHNYDRFLERAEQKQSQNRDNSQKKYSDYQYDRNFEDVF